MKTSTTIFLGLALLAAQSYLLCAADDSSSTEQEATIACDMDKLAILLQPTQCYPRCMGRTSKEKKLCDVARIIQDTSDNDKKKFILQLFTEHKVPSMIFVLTHFKNHHYRLPRNIRGDLKDAFRNYQHTISDARKHLPNTCENEADVNKVIETFEGVKGICNFYIEILQSWDDVSDEEEK